MRTERPQTRRRQRHLKDKPRPQHEPRGPEGAGFTCVVAQGGRPRPLGAYRVAGLAQVLAGEGHLQQLAVALPDQLWRGEAGSDVHLNGFNQRQ